MQKESEMKQNKFTLISLNARFPGITIKSSSQTPLSSSPRNEKENPPLLCKTKGLHQPTPTDKDSLKLLSSTAPIMLSGLCKTEMPRNDGSICYNVRESEKNKTNVVNESYKQATHCRMMTSKQSQGYSGAELSRIVTAKESCGTRKKALQTMHRNYHARYILISQHTTCFLQLVMVLHNHRRMILILQNVNL